MDEVTERLKKLDTLDLSTLPDPLPVPVVAGSRGKWRIETFETTPLGVLTTAIRATINDHPELLIKPGVYTRLVHEDCGVVMSNTPMEVMTNTEFVERAHGRVLINGLGLGMVLRAVLEKPEVEYVVVYELDEDVISMVRPGFYYHLSTNKLSIRQGNCFSHKPLKNERYDIAWHDVWDTISDENLPEMDALRRKWARRIPVQLCWAEDLCIRMRDRFTAARQSRNQPKEQ